MSSKEKLNQALDLIEQVRDSLVDDPGDDFPIPESQLRFKGGNLWKPSSDSDGNAVLLLRADWPDPDYVEVLSDDGRWVVLDYTGRSNPDRWTYRADRPGKDFAGKRKGGGVRIYYEDAYGFIPFPGPPRNRWE